MTANLKIDLITLFPSMVEGFLAESIVGKAVERQKIDVQVHNLRDWTHDKHKTADDRPFGGGAGMLMKPEPIFEAIESLKREDSIVVYMAPDGNKLNSKLGRELAAESHLIILSGHYEGVDQRVRDKLIDQEISIGDYILTNGTLPAAVLIDVLSRFIPGVLGDEKSLTQDSFTDNLLSFPQYTRPAEFRGMTVPEVLLSGNHSEIERWREEWRKKKTTKQRPDLLKIEKQ